MGAINIKDLVKLIFLCIGLMFATVVMAYLLASVIVYFKINTFDFNWSEALPDAFRVGGVGGTILGLGLWIKAKLQENKMINKSITISAF
ncbi:hypothetical protein GL249_22185 [Escherichia coli]|nr:hypothetical protein [Escherichia coli]EFM6597734.1 hypothetical protein [Escherichia coli]HDL9609899.1 hypothetical protein [Escherichia coli]